MVTPSRDCQRDLAAADGTSRGDAGDPAARPPCTSAKERSLGPRRRWWQHPREAAAQHLSGEAGCFWLFVGSVYLLLPLVLTVLAPNGLWENHVFGITMWWENDPGGSYLLGAHELLSQRGSMRFAGHPGLPMQLLLSLLQYLVYLLAGAGLTGLSFTEFIARHMVLVWCLSKLLCTVVHIGAIYCVFLFARAILASERAATLSALAYATSWPVLYYLSRISPEPWMVAFFCLSFLALWRYEGALTSGTVARAWPWALVAAGAAASALVSKMQLMIGLPFFCLGLIVFAGDSRGSAGRPNARSRFGGALVFTAGFVLTLLAYTLFMDWSEFFRLYRQLLADSVRTIGGGQENMGWLEGLALRSRWAFQTLNPKAFRPQCTRAQLFAFCEFPMLVLSGWGLALLVGLRGITTRLRWPLAYMLVTLVAWVLRSPGRAWTDFHYSFVILVVLAVGYGHLVRRLLGDSCLSSLDSRRWFAVGAITLLFHSPGLWAALDSRLQDVKQYRALKIEGYYRALSDLPPGARILVVGEHLRGFHDLEMTYARPGRSSALVQEIDGRFVGFATVSANEGICQGVSTMSIARVLELGATPARVVPIREWLRARGIACQGLAASARDL